LHAKTPLSTNVNNQVRSSDALVVHPHLAIFMRPTDRAHDLKGRESRPHRPVGRNGRNNVRSSNNYRSIIAIRITSNSNRLIACHEGSYRFMAITSLRIFAILLPGFTKPPQVRQQKSWQRTTLIRDHFGLNTPMEKDLAARQSANIEKAPVWT
jgi:hypothetical protein